MTLCCASQRGILRVEVRNMSQFTLIVDSHVGRDAFINKRHGTYDYTVPNLDVFAHDAAVSANLDVIPDINLTFLIVMVNANRHVLFDIEVLTNNAAVSNNDPDVMGNSQTYANVRAQLDV